MIGQGAVQCTSTPTTSSVDPIALDMSQEPSGNMHLTEKRGSLHNPRGDGLPGMLMSGAQAVPGNRIFMVTVSVTLSTKVIVKGNSSPKNYLINSKIQSWDFHKFPNSHYFPSNILRFMIQN